jgi:hypothetical protein
MRVVGIVLSLLVLSACGQAGLGGGSSNPSDPAGGGGGAAATEVKVNKSYWHRGFKVTLGTARVVEGKIDDVTRAVTIEATFQNLSLEYESDPKLYAVLTVGDRTYAEPADDLQDLPEVPPQRSQVGTIAFEVDEHFVLKDAVLIVGRPDVRQAVVPLGRAEGLVSLEPRPFTVSGKVEFQTNSTFFITVESGEVRSDKTLTHLEVATGKEWLRLSFSATNNSNAGMSIVFDDELTLKLPDGTTIGTDLTCSAAQIWPTPHSTASGGVACFLVPAPATGTYTFIWDNFPKGALTFTIG